MKKLLTLLLTASAVVAQEPRALDFWRAIETTRRAEEQRQLLLDLQIRAAYPNNPALYRYLDRNPRYIPLYLGK